MLSTLFMTEVSLFMDLLLESRTFILDILEDVFIGFGKVKQTALL